MSLPNKIQTLCKHLPLSGGARILLPTDYELRKDLEGVSKSPEFVVNRDLDPFDAVVFQCPIRNPKKVLTRLQDAILRCKPGGRLIVDGYVRQKSLIRVANRGVIDAVHVVTTLQMAEEVVQADFGPGDGLWVGRTSG